MIAKRLKNLSILLPVFCLCLVSCEKEKTIRERMEEDYRALLIKDGKLDPAWAAKYEIGHFLGSFNGYYYADFYIPAPEKTRKNWEIPDTYSFFDEFYLHFGLGSSAVFWKDGEIFTIRQMHEEKRLFASDLLCIGLGSDFLELSDDLKEASLDYLIPDQSEIDRPYRASETKAKSSSPSSPPATLREEICFKFAERYSPFVDRYLENLSGEKKEEESAKAKTWVERYLGNIGDAHIVEMGFPGLSKELSRKTYLANRDSLIFDVARENIPLSEQADHPLSFEAAFPLMIYKSGKFFNFDAFAFHSGLVNEGNYFFTANYPENYEFFEASQEEIASWQGQTIFDDSILDRSL